MQERYRTLMDGIKPKFNENRERKGRDWRGGKNVSAEDFREAFDFRGVEFGNWMQQKDRRQALNECYDSLMDLAMVCGVSPKALSLGGKLAMAFGARGVGKFNAHYEPGKVVINLTKTKGAGSLAHEWFHAIDNYFNMQGWDEFATESTRNVERKEMAEAWKDLVRAINGSDYFKRSDKYARLKGSRYWIEPTELGARAFAVWVENRLSKYGTINDYLANNPRLVDEKASDAEKKYAPYPFDKDADWMDEKFGRLFEVMQERVDEETGKHILYSRNKAAGHELTELTAEERELRDNLVERMRKGGLDVVTDSKEMQRVIDTENERTRMMGDKQKRALETATIAAEATNNATVISSADGAKIQNNLGTLATNYEKIANKTRGFITDLSHALGLKQHESSQYGTFETPDGKRITIRVSNHNARVSNFDKNNESEGISIVISSHKNKGLHNDGNAHIIEYFYPKRALENAEGKPLAEMIRSVSDALAGEEFKDTTGLAEREEVNSGSVREHRVYHGSGADFDAFDHSHMGDGEGAQAYGWGTYVTEVEGIGRTYANATAHNYNNALRPLERKIDSILTSLRINGSELDKARAGLRNAVRFKTKENYEEFLRRREEIEEKYGKHSTQYDDYLWNSPYAAAVRAIGHYENEIKERETELHSLQKDLEETRKQIDELPKEFPRHLYTVEIPDDNGGNYLDWNGHPAESLLKDVGSFLESEGFERVQDSPVRYEKGESTVVLNPNATGADLYAELREALGSDKKASQALAEVGCVGIKYPADNMRGGRKDGAKNYVIFNENDAKITDHTRFLRTADGEVYGLVKDGRIYLDPKVATAETAVHEYTHLWGDMLRRKDSEQWSHTVKELKNSVLWEEVKELYPELKTDDEIADEVLSTFSGRRGAERLREEARRVADGDGGVFTKAKAMAALERVKEAIARFWEGVARMFGINRHRSVEELADMAMRDLLDSKNPMKDESGMRKRGEVGDEGVKSLKGEEAMVALDNIFEDKKTENMPQKVSSLVKFMELFRKPVRTFLGEVVNVKEEVYNKIIREKRTSISGAVLPTLENADFAIRDTDGSTLYIKRFKSENNDNVYNIAVVNKYGEVEDYVSSVHIKSDNNLRNKITKGAELLLPQERITDGILPRNNSTPGAKVANYSETAKPRYSRKPGESIFVYASRVSEDVDRSVRERVSARDEYEKKVKSKGFQTKEALQNSMLGLQEFMYAIDHASGNRRYIEDIPDFENPILGENRLSSVNKEESHSRLDAVHSPTPTKGVRKPYLRSYTMIYMPLADIFFPRMYQAPDGFMAVRIQHMEFVIQTDETEFFL